LKHTKLTVSIAGAATALLFSGCVTTAHRQVTSSPAPQSAPATAVATAPPALHRPPVVRPVVTEEVLPEANDVYVSGAVNNDVVFVGGSTYIWVIGPDGQRHRHFYGHGDRRREVLRRRDNLRSVTAHRAGHPSMAHANIGHTSRHENAGHPQQLHAKDTAQHMHHPAPNLHANRPAQPDQRHAKQDEHSHKTVAAQSNARNRPASNTALTKTETSPRS
jgi:hypothetical protein